MGFNWSDCFKDGSRGASSLGTAQVERLDLFWYIRPVNNREKPLVWIGSAKEMRNGQTDR
jgi:hypothetical protein